MNSWRALAVVMLFAPLLCARTVKGRVVQDDNGAPVASAEVRVHRAGTPGLIADLETDSEGRFSAQDLPDGDYRIEVAKPNFANISLSVPNDSAGTNVIARLIRYAVIAGRVTTADGAPLSGASVLLLTRSPSGVFSRVRRSAGDAAVSAEGAYRIHGIPPGEYTVAVSYGASTAAVGSTSRVPPLTSVGSGLALYPDAASPRMFAIRGGEEYPGIDVVLSPGTLSTVSGRVDGSSEKARFWVALTSTAQPAIATAVAPAAEDGTFELRGVPSGTYYLSASGPVRGYGGMGAALGEEPLFARIRVQVSGQDVPNLVLTPQAGVSASVRLRIDAAAEKDCPSSASVNMTSLEDWGASFNRNFAVSHDSGASIAHLPPGRFGFEAAQLGDRCYQSGEAILDVASGAAAVEIPLSNAGSIRGTVDGADPAGVTVLLMSERSVRTAAPDRNGKFSLTALPPARYRIGARRNSDAREARWLEERAGLIEIDVGGGSRVEVELHAKPSDLQPR